MQENMNTFKATEQQFKKNIDEVQVELHSSILKLNNETKKQVR